MPAYPCVANHSLVAAVPRRGRRSCHLRIVAGRQTLTLPIRRSGWGICPRAVYDRTVDSATSRYWATSLIAHQSRGKSAMQRGYSGSL